MQIKSELAEFLASPVMIIVGTSDGHGRSEIARGAGARVHAGDGVVELVFSAWQWPATAANLRANGRVAVTFSRPTDYTSYQLKGAAEVHTAGAADIALSDQYLADMVTLFAGLGMPRALIAPWLINREALVARIRLSDIFVQTPGARAGQRMASP